MRCDISSADRPVISVVIPTSGRPSLFRAVESALGQEEVDVEVIVVVNNTTTLPQFDDARVKIVDNRSAPGQGPARQSGVNRANGPIIALLDDDDFWESRKCIEQLHDVRKMNSLQNSNWIAATGVTIHYPDGRRVQRPRCHNAPVSTADPAAYLFLRKHLKRTDNFIQSSTLMFPREIAHVVPFDALPEVCTDWGWVIATSKATKCQVVVGAGHRTHYDISGPGGVSKTNRIYQILAWADTMLEHCSRRIVGDFCATTPLQVTAHFGDVKGAIAALKHAYSKGRPGLPATLMAARSLLTCFVNYAIKKLRR